MQYYIAIDYSSIIGYAAAVLAVPANSKGNNYTIYNEKYFQNVSFCVITHPIGQNGRAVCKKHGNHGAGDARGAKRRALGAAAPAGRPWPSIASSRFEYEYSLRASRPSA